MDYRDSRWFKTINGYVGISVILVILIISVILSFIYIVQTYKYKLSRNPFSDDHRSVPTKILRVYLLLILAAGFVAVVYYDVNKMITSDPPISMKVEDNKLAPPLAFCARDPNNVNISSAAYIGKDNSKGYSPESFIGFAFIGNFTWNCKLFIDEEEKTGGIYEFFLSINNVNETMVVFIGHFTDMSDLENIDKGQQSIVPQGDIYSNTAGQNINNGQVMYLTYIETRYKELNGGETHRGFQFGVIRTESGSSGTVALNIVPPPGVTTLSEMPPLDLTVLFGNIGGYLSICGILTCFLFGGKRVRPFGFVTEYCFRSKDKGSLKKNLEKIGNYSGNVITEKDYQALINYYVDMELFDDE